MAAEEKSTLPCCSNLCGCRIPSTPSAKSPSGEQKQRWEGECVCDKKQHRAGTGQNLHTCSKTAASIVNDKNDHCCFHIAPLITPTPIYDIGMRVPRLSDESNTCVNSTAPPPKNSQGMGGTDQPCAASRARSATPPVKIKQKQQRTKGKRSEPSQGFRRDTQPLGENII